MIGLGADVNVQDDQSKTPLHYYASDFEDFVDVLQVLIDGGADLNAKDNEGKTALDIATDKGNTDIGKHLIAAGASL